MRVGAATHKIILPDGFLPTEGFARQIDELHVRALVLEKERRLALLAVELTSLPPEEIKALKAIACAASGAERAFVCATHTFSAPHFMPDHQLDEAGRAKKEQLREAVQNAAREAARVAAQGMKEARLTFGEARCAVNTARDVETPLGWWVDKNGGGLVDHRMTAIGFTDEAGTRIATLLHYPIQSSVLDGSQLCEGGKVVSGDLAGWMAVEVEERTNAPALFLIGAAGDQAPREKAVGFIVENGELRRTDRQDDAIEVGRRLAKEMAQAALEAIASEQPIKADTLAITETEVVVPAKKMERDLHKLHPTRIAPYEADGVCMQPVCVLTLGEAQLVGVLPELNCVTAKAITQDHPLARVVTLFDGGAKYMADADSYDRITYEAMNSPFGKGAAERLTEAARSLLEKRI